MRIKSGIAGLIAALSILAAFSLVNAESPKSIQTAKDVQQALNSQGYNAGPVDGNWGSKSRDALSKLQQENGLEPTGQINEEVLVALGVVPSESGAAAGGQQVTPGDQQNSPGLERSTDEEKPAAEEQNGSGTDQSTEGSQSNSPTHQGENQPGTGG